MRGNSSTLISVIIPCYNPQFNFFCEAVESVLSQSCKNWEIIIVNDGGCKNSQKLIEEYLNKLNNDRISLINLEKNYGVSTAKNKGIEAAKSSLITFLDSDDMLLPWDLDEIIETFKKNPDSLIVVSDYLLYLRLGLIKKIYISNTFWNFISGKDKEDDVINKIKEFKQTVFSRFIFKKEFFEALRFDPNIKVGEDTDLIVKILNDKKLFSRLKIAPIAGYLYRFYPCQNRLTHKNNLRFKFREMLINKYKDKEFLGCELIKEWGRTTNDWKFSKLLGDYLDHNSILRYIKDVLLKFHSLKDRYRAIRSLVRIIIVNKFLIPVFGIDLRYIDILLNTKNNKYKEIKNTFHEYLYNNLY